MHLAIFDCDGTLVDSQANICDAMEEAFGEAGLAAPDRNDIRRIVGLSLVDAMRALLPHESEDRHFALAESYKAAFTRYRAAGSVHEPLFDGIADTLDALESAGWMLGVATGKSDRGLHAVLDAHGIRHRFVTLHTADRHPSKPHPSMIHACLDDAGIAPENAAMIGDTTFDMDMAKAAHVRAIGVNWGYHDPDELIAAGAETVVESAAALHDQLEQGR